MIFYGMNFNQSTVYLRGILDVMQAKKCNFKGIIKRKKTNEKSDDFYLKFWCDKTTC